MNIWVDIINPSHALFFNVVLKDLHDERLQVTIRERAETVELAKMLGIEGRVVGSDYRNGVKKSLSMVGRTLALWTSVEDFDCALSFENGMSVMVSKMKGAGPSFCATMTSSSSRNGPSCSTWRRGSRISPTR